MENINDIIINEFQKWGYTQATISKWCREGLIPNATQDKPKSPWHIPKDAQCPRKIKGV